MDSNITGNRFLFQFFTILQLNWNIIGFVFEAKFSKYPNRRLVSYRSSQTFSVTLHFGGRNTICSCPNTIVIKWSMLVPPPSVLLEIIE